MLRINQTLVLSPLLFIVIFYFTSPITALQIYYNSDWVYVGNFTDNSGASIAHFDIYKPLCPGTSIIFLDMEIVTISLDNIILI